MLNVMRLGSGARIELFDGGGNTATGVIQSTTRKSLTITVGPVLVTDRELPLNLVLGVALPRGDRARFLVEKLTELGVSQLVPLVTGRSTNKPGKAAIAKFQRYVIEASKQCGRNQLMQVLPATRFEDFLAQAAVFESGLGLHPESDVPLTVNDIWAVDSLAVCVGPEGGWTPAELEMIESAGWQTRHLGGRILRTETAAILLASVFSTLANRLD